MSKTDGPGKLVALLMPITSLDLTGSHNFRPLLLLFFPQFSNKRETSSGCIHYRIVLLLLAISYAQSIMNQFETKPLSIKHEPASSAGCSFVFRVKRTSLPTREICINNFHKFYRKE